MSNILAAIGLGQLEVLEDKIATKRNIYQRYKEAFSGVYGLDMMPSDIHGRSTNWLSVVLVDSELFGSTRSQIMQRLDKENVESRPVWKPMHMQPVFRDCRVAGGVVSNRLFLAGLCLPSGTNLAEKDQDKIIDLILSLSHSPARSFSATFVNHKQVSDL